jgi:ketosteroid isomerase-like protein
MLEQPTATFTSTRADNLGALEKAYARWSETRGASAGDFLALLGDDVEMRSVLSPELPDDLAANRLTKAEAEDYFAVIARDWEMIAYDVDRFIGDGDDIVMVGRCHWRHKTTGGEVNSPKVDIWHFEGGKATRFLEMFDSLAFARAVGAV